MIVSRPTVAIIDGDTLLRERIGRYLEDVGYSVQGYGSSQAFLRERSPVDCVVIDLDLDQPDGEKLHARLCEEQQAAAVVITAAAASISQVVAAMQRGALTVLEKPYDPRILHENLNRGLAKAADFRRNLVERKRLSEKIQSLTQREIEVFNLLLRGNHVKQIGLTLGIGIKTVHTFRSNIFRKLGVESNSELIRAVALTFDREQWEAPERDLWGQACRASWPWRECGP